MVLHYVIIVMIVFTKNMGDGIILRSNTKNLKQEDDMISIQVAIATWGFNKRLCWMLSSIVQQKSHNDKPVPEVSVNLAYIRHQGVEELMPVFQSEGISIAKVVYEGYDKGFAYRGLVRNQQLKAIGDADWVMFADSDMVYPQDFFLDLLNPLKINTKIVLSAYSSRDQQ